MFSIDVEVLNIIPQLKTEDGDIPESQNITSYWTTTEQRFSKKNAI